MILTAGLGCWMRINQSSAETRRSTADQPVIHRDPTCKSSINRKAENSLIISRLSKPPQGNCYPTAGSKQTLNDTLQQRKMLLICQYQYCVAAIIHSTRCAVHRNNARDCRYESTGEARSSSALNYNKVHTCDLAGHRYLWTSVASVFLQTQPERRRE